MTESRRNFIRKTTVASLGLPIIGPSVISSLQNPNSQIRYPVCIFSKHLQFLDYDDMSDTVFETGLDGVDLGVRNGSHVEPDRVEEELPRAIEAIKKRGLVVPMMVTRIKDPDDPNVNRVLKTASEQGIQIYRMAYYKYEDDLGIINSIEKAKVKVNALADINRKYGIHGAYQNHSGNYMGAPVWDAWMLLKDLDPEWIGCQYDIMHATVEGANAWEVGLKLIRPYIKCVVVKDRKWEKVNGKWKSVNVPLGEGIVNLDKFLGYLKEFGFSGPISIHFEYPFFDESDHTLSLDKKRKIAVKHITRDVAYLKEKLKEAELI